MFYLNCSKKMMSLYKLKLDEDIPVNPKDEYPLPNWYVKPIIKNRKRFILFMERSTYFSFCIDGITSMNLKSTFKYVFNHMLEKANIPPDLIKSIVIDDRDVYITETHDRQWVGVSNEVTRFLDAKLDEWDGADHFHRDDISYSVNLFLFGGPDYKRPEDALRDYFNLEHKKRYQ